MNVLHKDIIIDNAMQVKIIINLFFVFNILKLEILIY